MENNQQNTPETPNQSSLFRKLLKKPVLLAVAGIFVVLVAVYLLVALYFRTHFMFRTEIDGQDVSGMTAKEAEDMIAGIIDGYEISVTAPSGEEVKISGKAVGLAYDSDAGYAEQILNKQSPFSWPARLFARPSSHILPDLSCDEALLAAQMEPVYVLAPEQTAPKSAYPAFDGEKYIIEPEVYGVSLNREDLQAQTSQAIRTLESALDLSHASTPVAPQYTSESPELIQTCDTLNLYLNTVITYPMDTPVVIDRTLISQWVSVNENLEISIDEGAIKAWLEQFGDKYDTVGTERTFTTPAGRSAKVSGGTYGWSINEDTEFTAIIEAIRSGAQITKEPDCYIGGTAASHAMPDWGNTYVDVDMSQQHMWYVKDGTVVFESDVVTGLPTADRVTPEGVYTILDKLTNTVLVGATDPATGQPSYRTPVSYWMRVTWSGIGFHDATWQSAFGGSRYQTYGSHGCINMPLAKAQEFYGMIEVGLPVVLHN